MIKMIVSDLDGTLLDHSKKVTDREIAALTAAREAGLALCLASGRMNVEMQQVLQEIGHYAHSVSQNGALIHLEDGTFLKSQRFESQLAHQVYQLVNTYDLVKLVGSGEANYIAAVSPASDAVQAKTFRPFIVQGNIAAALLDELAACKFSLFGELETLLEVQRLLEQQLGGQLEIFLSDKDCLDVMPLQVSKGNSLLILSEQLGLHPHEIACIGDSFNDVSMFGITPHSYAMKGAHPDVKKQAAHEVESVAEAIRRILVHNQEAAAERIVSLES